MLIVLAVAHQGEEFVLILPAILLVGALFILRWANAPDGNDGAVADQPEDVSASSEEVEEARELQSVGGGDRLLK